MREWDLHIPDVPRDWHIYYLGVVEVGVNVGTYIIPYPNTPHLAIDKYRHMECLGYMESLAPQLPDDPAFPPRARSSTGAAASLESHWASASWGFGGPKLRAKGTE